MPSINDAVLDLKCFDLLANGTTSIHNLDARAKVLVTGLFIISVVSFGRYELAALLSFFLFPAAMIALSNLPARLIARKIALLCPLVLIIGIFNPLIDREIMVNFGSFGVSGGWVSFLSIIVKSILTVSSALILVGVTGFTAICRALEKLGVPQVFAVQLLFLYRYIFVLAEEARRASMAREMRSCGKKGLGIASYGSMIGHLLLRTWQRADRIHMAMLAGRKLSSLSDGSLCSSCYAFTISLIYWGDSLRRCSHEPPYRRGHQPFPCVHRRHRRPEGCLLSPHPR
jgi:cobalt/nickel transport system permease protein